MRKIKLLLAAMAALVGLQANAAWVTPTKPTVTYDWATPTAGETYYIFNVGAGTFLGGGSSWGTRAVSTTNNIWKSGDANITPKENVYYALPWTISLTGELYKLQHSGTTKSNRNLVHYDNAAWIDQASSDAESNWKIISTENGYLIKPENAGENVSFGVHGTNLVSATAALTWTDLNYSVAPETKWVYWRFIPASQIDDFQETIAGLPALMEVYEAKLRYEAIRTAVLAIPSQEVYASNATAVSTLNSAVDTQDEAATAATTIEQVNAAIAAIRDAAANFMSTVTLNENAYFDVTDAYVTNADFSSKSGDGWTRTQTSVGNQQFGTGAMESWNNNNVSVLQDLTGLPNGRYRVSCDMISGNDTKTAYVYAKGMAEVIGENVTAKASAGDYTTMSNEVAGNTISAYPVLVDNHTMTIGFKDPSGWVVVDNFKIIYYGPDLTALKEVLQNMIDGVPALEGTTTTAAYNAAKNYADGINVESLSTEDAISTASSELSALIATAESLQASYSHYTTIKAAAKAVAASLNTTTPDAALNAATTVDAINAAIASLRSAFLAELPNVTIPNDPGYLDVTAVMVENAGVRQNTDFWTKEGTPNGNDSFGKCAYNECEFYAANFKFYQTLALSTGTWEFGVTGFHRAGNHTTYFYAGDDKILIPGVENTVVNTMAAAETYFDGGNGKVALKFVIESNQDVEIGIDNQDTETDKWTIFRDFTLKYYGEPDYSTYATRWNETVTAANEALGAQAYKYVSGNERTAVTDAIADAPDGTSKANYLEKIEALEAATAAFKAVAPSYNAYVLAKTAVQNLWGSNLGVAAPTTAAEAAAAVTSGFNVAQYNKVASDYTYSLTGKIGEFSTWTKVATSGGAEDTPQTLSTEHFRGNGYTYYEQGVNGWASNSFTVDYSKTATLPAGNYVIKVATRASANVTGTVSATATANTVAIANVGASSKGITTSGAASFDEGEFANGGNGFGWQWRFLPFTVAEEGNVTITIHAESSSEHGWVSIADAELLSDADKSTKVDYDEAANNTIEDVDVATVTITRTIKEGFNTVCLPFSLTAGEVATAFGTGSEVYTFSENSADPMDATINFNKGDGSITANVPVLVKAVSASTEQVFSGVQILAPTADAKVEGKNFDFVGVYAPQDIDEGDWFLNGSDIYKATDKTQGINAFRAYFQTKGESSSVKLYIEGIETSIRSINGLQARPAGVIYNLAGQRMQKAQKGINIVNGKKVVIR